MEGNLFYSVSQLKCKSHPETLSKLMHIINHHRQELKTRGKGEYSRLQEEWYLSWYTCPLGRLWERHLAFMKCIPDSSNFSKHLTTWGNSPYAIIRISQVLLYFEFQHPYFYVFNISHSILCTFLPTKPLRLLAHSRHSINTCCLHSEYIMIYNIWHWLTTSERGTHSLD